MSEKLAKIPNKILFDLSLRMWEIFNRQLDRKQLPGDKEEMKELYQKVKDLYEEYNMPIPNMRIEKMKMLKESQKKD